MEMILGDVGSNCTIELPFHCDYGRNIHIGKNFYSNIHLTVLDCADIYIGDDVLIGPNVGIYSPDHALDPMERAASLERSLPVYIRDRVNPFGDEYNKSDFDVCGYCNLYFSTYSRRCYFCKAF